MPNYWLLPTMTDRHLGTHILLFDSLNIFTMNYFKNKIFKELSVRKHMCVACLCLWVFMCLCVHVCMCGVLCVLCASICVCVCLYVYTEARCQHQESSSANFHLILRQGLSLTLKLTGIARLAGPWAPKVLLSPPYPTPSAGTANMYHGPCFLYGCWESEFRRPAHTARALLTMPYLQSQYLKKKI